MALCSESEHCSPTSSSSSVLLRCTHAVHIKFMNSRRYTLNQSESMNQKNDQCAHTFSQSVSETKHKLLGGVWLLSVNISGRYRQHAHLHQQLQRNGRESGVWGKRWAKNSIWTESALCVCVCVHVHAIGLINEQCSSLFCICEWVCVWVCVCVCVCVCGHACVCVWFSTNPTHLSCEEMTERSQLGLWDTPHSP